MANRSVRKVARKILDNISGKHGPDKVGYNYAHFEELNPTAYEKAQRRVYRMLKNQQEPSND